MKLGSIMGQKEMLVWKENPNNHTPNIVVSNNAKL